MTVEMTRFNASLDRAKFQALNGKTDPFELLSAVTSSIGDAQTMMERAGILGWEPEIDPAVGHGQQGQHLLRAGEQPRHRRAAVPRGRPTSARRTRTTSSSGPRP